MSEIIIIISLIFIVYLLEDIRNILRKKSAESLHVHLNTSTEHQKHETEPDAQPKEPEDTKSL